MARSARRILSSSICFVRLLMFKPAILKPRPEGRKSERIVLSNESMFWLGIPDDTSLGWEASVGVSCCELERESFPWRTRRTRRVCYFLVGQLKFHVNCHPDSAFKIFSTIKALDTARSYISYCLLLFQNNSFDCLCKGHHSFNSTSCTTNVVLIRLRDSRFRLHCLEIMILVLVKRPQMITFLSSQV